MNNKRLSNKDEFEVSLLHSHGIDVKTLANKFDVSPGLIAKTTTQMKNTNETINTLAKRSKVANAFLILYSDLDENLIKELEHNKIRPSYIARLVEDVVVTPYINLAMNKSGLVAAYKNITLNQPANFKAGTLIRKFTEPKRFAEKIIRQEFKLQALNKLNENTFLFSGNHQDYLLNLHSEKTAQVVMNKIMDGALTRTPSKDELVQRVIKELTNRNLSKIYSMSAGLNGYQPTPIKDIATSMNQSAYTIKEKIAQVYGMIKYSPEGIIYLKNNGFVSESMAKNHLYQLDLRKQQRSDKLINNNFSAKSLDFFLNEKLKTVADLSRIQEGGNLHLYIQDNFKTTADAKPIQKELESFLKNYDLKK